MRPLTAYYLTLSPRDAATGAVVTVRLAGGGRAGYKQFGSTAWKAGLERPPAIAQRLGFDGSSFEGEAAAAALSVIWNGTASHADALKSHYWKEAPFTLHKGPDGGADGDMTLLLKGRVSDVLATPGQITFELADASADYAKPVLQAKFLGTGGIEGDAELKGQDKGRVWGALFNVSLRVLDKANNIHVCSDPGFPIDAFVQAYDKGNAASALTFVAWAGSIDATLAALIATPAPSGGAAVAPSISCLKWWHGQPGKLTVDIRGSVGAGYVDRPVDIAARILESVGALDVDIANVNAQRLLRNYSFGWMVSDGNSTAISEVVALLAGIGAWIAPRADGKMIFGTYDWGAPLMALRSALSEDSGQYGPVDKINLGWRTNQTIMARGDIAEAVFAGDVNGLGALATQGSIDFATQVDPTGKPELNADVTMVVTSPPPISVAYNFDTSIKDGQLPKTLNFKLLRGAGADVTALAAWSAVLKSGSAAFSMGAATGILEITSLSSDAAFEASAIYLGTTRKGQSSATRKIDDPPVMTGGGGGATSDSTSSINTTTSSAYGAAATRILSIAAGTGGVVNLTLAGEFSRATAGNASAFGKWQWRVVGGTFADVAAEIASSSSASTSGPPEPDTTPGTIAVNQQKSGLTAGVTYEFQLLLRGSVSVTLNWLGTASGVGG